MMIRVDTASDVPIYEQLRNQIVIGIASGELSMGQKIPSMRKLALELGINYQTANKAYTILAEEGYVQIDKRKGVVISNKFFKSDEYNNALMQKMQLVAAEAICHCLSEKEFVAICTKQYQKIIKGAGK